MFLTIECKTLQTPKTPKKSKSGSGKTEEKSNSTPSVHEVSNSLPSKNLILFLSFFFFKLIARIGKEGFERAAEIDLSCEFAFQNAFLLCEGATRELCSLVLQEKVISLAYIETPSKHTTTEVKIDKYFSFFSFGLISLAGRRTFTSEKSINC